jgi:DNA-binding beta-propeller fold protein YncE
MRPIVMVLACVATAELIISAARPLMAADAALVLEKTIPLPDVSGRIDHLAVDLKGGRLFVAELGNHSIDVVDLHTDKVVHRIGGLNEPQGIAYLADQRLLAVANAGDGTLRLYHTDDFSAQGSIDLKDDADNVRISPLTRTIIVGYGSGGLAVIDPGSAKKIADIQLPDHPEGFQIEPNGQRAFVNVPGARQISVVDLTSNKQTAAWKVRDLRSNFPLAIAGPDGPLAAVFRSPATLALFDLKTGAISARRSTCGDADDVSFDDKRNRFYVSCGEGLVDIVRWDNRGLTAIDRVSTRSGARTSLFVPELDRLYVAARAGWFSSDAAILVLRPKP